MKLTMEFPTDDTVRLVLDIGDGVERASDEVPRQKLRIALNRMLNVLNYFQSDESASFDIGASDDEA